MNFSISWKVGFAWLLMVTLSSCGNEGMETRSGLKVTLIRKGEGGPAIRDGIARLYLAYSTADGRKLFDTNRVGIPVPVKMTEDDKGLLDEVVDILNVGDSVTFEFPAEDLFEKTYGMSLPDSIQRGTNLVFHMSLHSTLTTEVYEELVELASAKQISERHEHEQEHFIEEVAEIDQRLDSLGVAYVRLGSGVRYVVKKAGKGRKAQQGEKINVYYEGRFFSDGQVFDKRDKTAEPYSFFLGSGVIDGWSLALAELKEGTSATVYIPSKLGYGEGGQGEIPGHSILVFDIDFVKIGE